MARENPTWGRRRIQAELALLGYEVAELTVAKYMHRTSPRPSPTWRAFLATHARDIVAVDFFLVPTLTFRLLFVFVVLRHDRRELLHLNVTDHPTAVWTARQIIEAFPDDSAPRFLLRDRDAIYGEEFARRVKRMGIREVLIAPRAPWQNPFVERVIGSIRRECLDHFLILSEAHLRRLLHGYIGDGTEVNGSPSSRRYFSRSEAGSVGVPRPRTWTVTVRAIPRISISGFPPVRLPPPGTIAPHSLARAATYSAVLWPPSSVMCAASREGGPHPLLSDRLPHPADPQTPDG